MLSLSLSVQHSDQRGVVLSKPVCGRKYDFLNNVKKNKKQDETMTTDPWLLGHVVLRHRHQKPGFCGRRGHLYSIVRQKMASNEHI